MKEKHYQALIKVPFGERSHCLRPYHVGNTGSRPITEVKQRWARLVLAWVTGWEYWVLPAFASKELVT